MDKALKHQVIDPIYYTYIAILCNQYTSFMGVKVINLIHDLMVRYRKITKTDLKENQMRFD